MIGNWCTANFLTLNTSKTKLLCFKHVMPELHLELEPQLSVRFLGLNIDPDLKFKSHIEALNSKLASGCYAIRSTRRELGFAQARTVYFALVESHLRFAIQFWGACSQELFSSVFLLQKKAVRLLCQVNSRETCKPLFIKHSILTLVSLFILETASIIFKNKHLYENNNRSGRFASNLALITPRSTLVKDSFIFNGIKIFNKLPSEIKNLETIRKFRNSLDRLLAKRAYYDLTEFFEDHWS
uniref:Uncharacterized protein LOC114329146 n=1 Tax=Diabrotica virgifera virgifera TaxID=50390 RepID=A0A6P7FE26_DIAVI